MAILRWKKEKKRIACHTDYRRTALPKVVVGGRSWGGGGDWAGGGGGNWARGGGTGSARNTLSGNGDGEAMPTDVFTVVQRVSTQPQIHSTHFV